MYLEHPFIFAICYIISFIINFGTYRTTFRCRFQELRYKLWEEIIWSLFSSGAFILGSLIIICMCGYFGWAIRLKTIEKKKKEYNYKFYKKQFEKDNDVIALQTLENINKFEKLEYGNYDCITISIFSFLRMIGLFDKLNRTDISRMILEAPEDFGIKYGDKEFRVMRGKTSEGMIICGFFKFGLFSGELLTIDSNFNVLDGHYSLDNDPYCEVIDTGKIDEKNTLDMTSVIYDEELLKYLNKNGFNYLIVSSNSVIIENARILSLPGEIRSRKLELE